MNRQLKSSVRSTKVSDLDNCSRLYGQRQSADTMLTISICYTQLFYDNRKYFEFVEQAKAAGINIPIIPGIKPFKKLSQLSMIPKTFKVDLPEDLVKEALKCKNDAEAEQVGIEWCVAQCKELMAHGVPSIHFYSIGAVDSIKEVAKIIY